MDREAWRHAVPLYLLFVLAFPLSMFWVETHQLHGPTPCIFRLTTHLDCPGCGLTRSFRAMGRLDVMQAIRYNPLGPAIFVVTVFGWGFAVCKLLTRGQLPLPGWWIRYRLKLLYAWIIVYLIVGFGRMIYEVHHPPPPPHPWPILRILSIRD